MDNNLAILIARLAEEDIPDMPNRNDMESDNNHEHGATSEIRQDLVSGDWVVIATGRAKRPHDFLSQKKVKFDQPKSSCPFEKSHVEALLSYALDGGGKNMRWVEVIPNKFPAFHRGLCNVFHNAGPYQWTDGVGSHEVVITRDHKRSWGEMSDYEAELVVRAYQERCHALKEDKCVRYISIFHNHGREAGATISHPHSQIITIPVIPSDVARSIRGSASFFAEHKQCVHCIMLQHEKREKSRIIYENDDFTVFAPFASRVAFEIRVYPKRHASHFEQITPSEMGSLGNALRTTLAKFYKGLGNPDYNFFLHTAPIDPASSFSHYHWHFEILPKTAIWAGFEIGTGIEISTIAPEDAADFLKKVKV